MTIIETKLADKAEQFTIGDDHYVGRRVQQEENPGKWIDVTTAFQVDSGWIDFVMFRLDYSKGDIFVDPALLRPFPDSKIEETSK